MDPIAELEKRIQESKRLVAEQENALAVLKKAFGGIGHTPAPVLAQSKTEKIGAFNFGDLAVSNNKQRSKVTEEVKSVVSNFGDNEFTVLHVEAALLQRGIVIESKTPRARIALALAKLLEERFVTRVFEGSGNVPHRYLLKGETPTATTVSVSSVQPSLTQAH